MIPPLATLLAITAAVLAAALILLLRAGSRYRDSAERLVEEYLAEPWGDV